MADGKHHWHVTWLDKFSEAIQCCHCGQEKDEHEFMWKKAPSCGDKARSRPTRLMPVSDVVLLTRKECLPCEGRGCDACDHEGVLVVELPTTA